MSSSGSPTGFWILARGRMRGECGPTVDSSVFHSFSGNGGSKVALDVIIVHDSVDSSRKSGDHRIAVSDEESRELCGTKLSLFTGVSSADDRNTGRVDEVPEALKVEKLDRVIGVAELLRVVTSAVDTDAKVLNTRVPNRRE
jgi:hypothetical protein